MSMVGVPVKVDSSCDNSYKSTAWQRRGNRLASLPRHNLDSLRIEP